MSDAIAPKKSSIETWYVAHLVYGACQLAFIPILVPAYVLETTGSPAQAGTAMMVIGLGAFLAPVIGAMADKLRAHRIAQLAGLAAYAVGALMYAFLGTTTLGIFGGAAMLGVGSATLLMINPAFVVSAGFAPDEEAARLTRLNQTMIVGLVIFGLVIPLVLGMGYPALFIVMAALSVGGLFVTAATNGEAAARIKVADPADAAEGETQGGGIGALLFSAFGLFLLAVFFVTIGQAVITSQAVNYMQDVFAIDAGTTAVALSASGVIALVVLDLVGRLMGKTGPGPIWSGSVLLKVVTMALLVMLALGGTIGAVLPLAVYVVYLLAINCVDMVQPALSARGSSAGAGTTQGLLMFAIASAYAVGAWVAGVSAENLGFGSLPWVVAIVTGIALVLGIIAIAGINRRGGDEAAEA